MINKLSTLSIPPRFPLKTKQGDRSGITVRVNIKKPSSIEARQRISTLTDYFPAHIINYGNRVFQSAEAAECTNEELASMRKFNELMDVKPSTNNQLTNQ
jgi:hypothetical protein